MLWARLQGRAIRWARAKSLFRFMFGKNRWTSRSVRSRLLNETCDSPHGVASDSKQRAAELVFSCRSSAQELVQATAHSLIESQAIIEVTSMKWKLTSAGLLVLAFSL